MRRRRKRGEWGHLDRHYRPVRKPGRTGASEERRDHMVSHNSRGDPEVQGIWPSGVEVSGRWVQSGQGVARWTGTRAEEEIPQSHHDSASGEEEEASSRPAPIQTQVQVLRPWTQGPRWRMFSNICPNTVGWGFRYGVSGGLQPEHAASVCRREGRFCPIQCPGETSRKTIREAVRWNPTSRWGSNRACPRSMDWMMPPSDGTRPWVGTWSPWGRRRLCWMDAYIPCIGMEYSDRWSYLKSMTFASRRQMRRRRGGLKRCCRRDSSSASGSSQRQTS